jgi:secreted PhoX family phosphatase
MAGGAAGGTPLDGPSGLGLDPRRARLLVACRGGPANPMGHVLEIRPEGGEHAAATAAAALLFAAGDPAGPGRYGGAGLAQGVAFPENPASLAIDAEGRAWIGTDPGAVIRGQSAGLFLCALEGPARGVPRAIYAAPRGAAIGGVALAPEGGGAIIGVRHPGAGPGQDFARPGTRWPQFQPGVPPRSTLIGLGAA